MVKRLTENKKIFLVLIITLIIALGVMLFVVLGVNPRDDKKGNTTNIEVESEEGLDVVEEDENITEAESDTSSFWEDDELNDNSSETDINNDNASEGTTDADNEETNIESENGDMSNEEILQDDKVWGEVR